MSKSWNCPTLPSRWGSDTVVYEGENYPFMNFGTTSEFMTDSNILYGAFPEQDEVLITEEMADGMAGTPEDMIGNEVEVKLSVNGNPLIGTYTVSGIYTAGNAIGPAGAFDSVFHDDGHIRGHER